MKPLIVYQTRTGNTRIIADAMASLLGADIYPVESITPDQLKGRTLVGLGSGIYWTKIDPRIYKAASLLPKDCNTFIFITTGMGSAFMLWLYKYRIEKSIKKLGVNLIGYWDCRGYDQHPLLKWMGISKGHPDATDVESARQFATRMLAE